MFDGRVVVADGQNRSGWKTREWQFIDPPDVPAPAGIDWFRGASDDDRNLAGFGTDAVELDTKMHAEIDRVCLGTEAPYAGSAR
jgi:hypothetical protein